MTKEEFLRTLERALRGRIPEEQVRENVEFYRGYIDGEIAGGRSEAAVLDELGDPRLIARTIHTTVKAGSTVYRQPEEPSDKKEHNIFSWIWIGVALLAALLVFGFFFGAASIVFHFLWIAKVPIIIAILVGLFFLLRPKR